MNIQVLASGSSGNAYIVSDGQTRILLDCGLPWTRIKKASGYTTSTLDAILLTHEHGDHSRGAKDAVRDGQDVYMSRGTADALGLSGHHRCHITEPQNTFTVNTLHVMALPVEHDAAEPYAYLMGSTATGEKLIYVTDTPYMPYRIPGITHMMVEANYDADLMSLGDVPLNRRVMRSHMSIDALIQWINTGASRKSVREVWLLHLSDSRSDAAEFKRRVQAATGAEVTVP